MKIVQIYYLVLSVHHFALSGYQSIFSRFHLMTTACFLFIALPEMFVNVYTQFIYICSMRIIFAFMKERTVLLDFGKLMSAR